MALRVEILAKPDDAKKCDEMERTLKIAAHASRVQIEINRTNQFGRFSQLAINPAQTPVIIIDGNIEFSGRRLDFEMIKQRLYELAFRKGSF